MSIEARALGKLIVAIESMQPEMVPPHVTSALIQSKYWVSPVQTFRNHLYNVWERNQNWSREKFLTYARSFYLGDFSGWEVRCICLGDMNYRVENEGFFGWAQAKDHATETDFAVLDFLCRGLQTPVGYKCAALIAGVGTILRVSRAHGMVEVQKALEEDLSIFTDEYLKLRYDLLVQVEQKLREEVPVFQPSKYL